MSEHKTKYFKGLFEANADEFSKKAMKGRKMESTMTKSVFVSLAGQIYGRAKARYKKRYRQKAMEFVEWLDENKYTRNLQNSKIFWYKKADLPNANFKTIEELFEIWKKQN